jgi:hypothetical protein
VSSGFNVTQSGQGNFTAFGNGTSSVENMPLFRFDIRDQCIRFGQFTCVYGLPDFGFRSRGVAGQRR